MKYIIVAVTAALIGAVTLGSTKAPAQGLIVNHCSAAGCSTTYIGPTGQNTGLGKVIQVPQDDSPEALARTSAWESYCHPKIVVDDFGIRRYVYAHKGCEYGKNE